ncbi:hypothetical protein BDW69DRAFT_188536 [Aspergillus filifer]
MNDNPHRAVGRYTRFKAFSILLSCLRSPDKHQRDSVVALYNLLPPLSELEADKDGDLKPPTQEVQLGNLILDLAEQIPYAHPAQMKLAHVVQQFPITYRCTRLVEMEEYNEYRGMDKFRQTCGSWFSPSFEAQHQLNAVAFQARLSTLGIIDNIFNEIWAMRLILEVPSSKIQAANFSTRVAITALWVLDSVDFCTEPLAEYIGGCFAPKELYDDAVIGIERWRFRMGRLKDVCENGSGDPDRVLTQEARGLGLGAVKLMEALAEIILEDKLVYLRR